MSARRRVSYVIPSSESIGLHVPRLRFPSYDHPRFGQQGPVLLPAATEGRKSGYSESPNDEDSFKSPRHRLGVSSLVLDTSTVLAGHDSPQGILYSAGRDGLAISYDLGVPMKPRMIPPDDGLRLPGGRWEIMTGWGDPGMDDDDDGGDSDLLGKASDGDVLGEVTTKRAASSRRQKMELPYESRWETNVAAFKPGQPSQFRQCAQLHSDWINDIVLCNYNQTLVSASSDGTIKAWNPHDPPAQSQSIVGTHKDYVRCLAYCREQNWIASGSFDRTIKLWDLTRSSSSPAQHTQSTTTEPLLTLNPADPGSPKSSVYAIAADPYGHAIASGSPERVVRMWDPRSGKRTSKLVGHTDNIRAILISDDSRYLLTGSADASIKLWSLASQRCLHTFTHHTDSIWALHSTHPTLEVFYSGDRSGLVCKVDVEDCSDVAEGECILLSQDTGEHGASTTALDGINKIVAMDDNLLWTATGSSSIKRWRVPQRRTVRASALTMPDHGAMYDLDPVGSQQSFSRMAASTPTPSQNQGHAPRPHRDSSATAASHKSLPVSEWTPQRDKEDESTLYGIPYESLVKLVSANDPFTPYPYASAGGSGGGMRDTDVATLYSSASVMSVPRTNLRPTITPFPSNGPGNNPPHSSTSRMTDEGMTVSNPTARAEYEERDIAGDAEPLTTTPDNVIPGDHGLVRSVILSDRIHALTVDTSGEVGVWDIVKCVCKGKFLREDVLAAASGDSSSGGGGEFDVERSPREALECVRERIEGEGIVQAWATADTKTGVLAIHLTERCFESEVYADEVGFVHDRHVNDETKINPGKWILRNLFLNFIREEQRNRRRRSGEDSLSSARSSPTSDRRSRAQSTPKWQESNNGIISSPTMIPVVMPVIPKSTPRSSPLIPSLIPLFVLQTDNLHDDTTPMPPQRVASTDTSLSAQTPAKEPDYFALKPNRHPASGVPNTPDDFSSVASPKADAVVPTTPGGGLIGRLKNLGGKMKRANSDTGVPLVTPSAPSDTLASVEEVVAAPVLTPLQALLATPLSPPPSLEAPTIPLPPGTSIVLSQEASAESGSGFNIVYRGSPQSTGADARVLETEMPMWLLEYLLLNQLPASSQGQVKMSFVLMPYPVRDGEGEELPELLNTTQSKLTASRLLRVRKLVSHVQDKLDSIQSSDNSQLPSSPTVSERSHHPSSARPKAEDVYEILCNDIVLPLDMTLAAVRQFVWRQPIELVMHYRKKTH